MKELKQVNKMTELEEIERALSSNLVEWGVEQIPVWALPIIFNDDFPETEEDRIAIERFYDRYRNSHDYVRMYICPVEEDLNPYFSYFPAFGLGSEVVDCKIFLELRQNNKTLKQ